MLWSDCSEGALNSLRKESILRFRAIKIMEIFIFHWIQLSWWRFLSGPPVMGTCEELPIKGWSVFRNRTGDWFYNGVGWSAIHNIHETEGPGWVHWNHMIQMLVAEWSSHLLGSARTLSTMAATGGGIIPMAPVTTQRIIRSLQTQHVCKAGRVGTEPDWGWHSVLEGWEGQSHGDRKQDSPTSAQRSNENRPSQHSCSHENPKRCLNLSWLDSQVVAVISLSASNSCIRGQATCDHTCT